MVTKQEQLEWLVSKIVKWPADGAKIPVSIDDAGNPKFYMPWDAFAPWDVMRVDFTHEEWQQERDKMQKQAERPAQPTPDNSWHERGELPQVGCECSAVCDGQWVTVEVLRHRVNNAGMNVAAVMSCASFNVFWATDFRPIRTEREKAIDAACAAVCKAGPYDHERELIGKLYDAGMLK